MSKRRPDFALPAGAKVLTALPEGITPWHLALNPGMPVQLVRKSGEIESRKVTKQPWKDPTHGWFIELSGMPSVWSLPQVRPFKKPSKYRNIRTPYNGRTYDSKAEAARAQYLDGLKASGVLLEWIPQPRFMLGCPENVYVPDFLVCPVQGQAWAEDVKGTETAKFKRDKKLWRAYARLDLHVIGKGGKTEVIKPKGTDG